MHLGKKRKVRNVLVVILFVRKVSKSY